MKETLKQRIEAIIEQLKSRESLLVRTISNEAEGQNYAEAYRLQTRLSMLRDILHDLKKTLE